MMTTTLKRVRTGTVGAYLTSGDAAAIRRVRDRTGRVTVSGKSGLKALNELAAAGDLHGVDYDPARYMARDDEDGSLFAIDWVAEQRRLGLNVVRSAGAFVDRKDPVGLKAAFAGALGADVTRLVSLSSYWLRGDTIPQVLAAIRNCDDNLSLVLADQFDPLRGRDEVESLRMLMDAATVGERRFELLRTDTHAIAFAAAGGTLGAIGLTTSGRHHGRPMNQNARKSMDERSQSPLVWVRQLMSWQRGIRLGALADWGGAGLTDCSCEPCEGRDLLRFNKEFRQVPNDVRADAQTHDVSSWVDFRNEVLGAADPQAAWADACAMAERVAAHLVQDYKVSALTTPASLKFWA
jgi:hypothetical protein